MACATGPHGTRDPTLIVIEAPRTDTTIAAPTAATTATTSADDDHRDVHVCVRASTWFTAAHPRR